MKSSKNEALKKWHAEQVLKGDVWNMRNEMLEYCKSDVKLMKEGCMKFASDFEKEAGEMTDELDGENITVFGSAGPKSYSYKTDGQD